MGGLAALLGVVLLTASACTVSGLDFREDRRVSFEAPRYREKVSLPVIVDWTVEEGFTVTGPTPTARPEAGYFGVLVDTEPPPPNQTLAHLARGDRACRAAQGCPDKEYLAERGIHTTTKTEFTISEIGPAPGVDLERGDRDLHTVTVILLDGLGRRIGESEWTQTFEVVGR